MSYGADLIAKERARQVDEGYTREHDDLHRGGSLAIAAALYAIPPGLRGDWREPVPGLGHLIINLTDWLHRRTGWRRGWFKPAPENRVRELVKAGALIAAEIDRLADGGAGGRPADRCAYCADPATHRGEGEDVCIKHIPRAASDEYTRIIR